VGSTQGGPGTSSPERFIGNSVTLATVLWRAYGVQQYQLSGADWITTARYDIVANVPAGTTPEEFKLMLQSLVEERFNLKFHREPKEFRAYNLVPAKNGVKLRDSVPTDGCSAGAISVSGIPCPKGAGSKPGIAKSVKKEGLIMVSPQGAGRIATGIGAHIPDLANMVQIQLAGPIIIDKTGLSDVYDFRLEFSSPTATVVDDTPYDSLFTALEKEFGLKLESTTTSVDMLVIDHVDKNPTEN